ncbi:hypothetical protein CEXT_622001 [Caerostris extrusa]|uniref:Uncharacterized protein n=1 Tax=Caerostris extrusa TaxID=172846 RepID=A0AAV4YB94_CAEEX|nr:hypothetical protein CEXT_622001 [Caerostris extrusa]
MEYIEITQFQCIWNVYEGYVMFKYVVVPPESFLADVEHLISFEKPNKRYEWCCSDLKRTSLESAFIEVYPLPLFSNLS